MVRTWKPTVAGILLIISGVAQFILLPLLLFTFTNLLDFIEDNNNILQSLSLFWSPIVGPIVIGVFMITSGIFAMLRKRYRLTLVSSIIASLIIIGIPALIFTLRSKEEFAKGDMVKQNLPYQTAVSGSRPKRTTLKPTVAGILDIIAGLVVGIFGVLTSVALSIISWGESELDISSAIFWGILGICLSVTYAIITIRGGLESIQRDRWRPALVASILSALTIIGIPALVLTINSKDEYEITKGIIKLYEIYKPSINDKVLRQKTFVSEEGIYRFPSIIGCPTCQCSDSARYRNVPWCNAPNPPEIKDGHCSEYKLK